MPVSPGLGISVAAGVSYYRITSLAFRTAGSRHHPKVVNGEVPSAAATGRGTLSCARAVYLAEIDPPASPKRCSTSTAKF